MPRLPPIQSQKCGDSYEPMDLDVVDSDEVDEILVLDDVNLDLESYISHYHGLPRIYRLEFVADHCKSLRVEALQMAINYIKEYTYNVKDYTRLFKKLQDAKQDPHLMIDNEWIDRKTKQANFRLEKLDNDLKTFRSNSMKENIRRGQDDMGDHYLDCGDLENAFNAYAKSRDFSTTQRNTVNQCLNMIGVSILLKRWSSVSNHILRAESQPPSDSPNANPAVVTKLACASGLFDLNARQYKRAANHFLSTNFEHFTQPIMSTSTTSTSSASTSSANNASGGGGAHNGPNWYNINSSAPSRSGFLNSIVTSQPVRFPDSSGHMAILAPVNIAVYGSLCALATYTRDELSANLINSASFKQFSELDPQLREAVAKFHGAKYAACLSILEEIKNSLLLDMYLAPHVERLYQAIRSKALVQYFQPYSTAKMTKMAQAFNTSFEELEREIIPLIQEGHLNARIDSVNKILYAKRTDPRIQTFERAIKFGKLWQRQAEALITRTVIQKAELTVTGEPQSSNI